MTEIICYSSPLQPPAIQCDSFLTPTPTQLSRTYAQMHFYQFYYLIKKAINFRRVIDDFFPRNYNYYILIQI